jgi:hypothetical protein
MLGQTVARAVLLPGCVGAGLSKSEQNLQLSTKPVVAHKTCSCVAKVKVGSFSEAFWPHPFFP